MESEKILKHLQKHMEYTDEEMEIFLSDPEKVKIVTETPDFVKTQIVAEVIYAHGCHAKHRVGDKFVMTAGGQLIAEKCPKRMCLAALGPVSRILPAIYDRLISKSDPHHERTNLVQCQDIGLDQGGWGKILMKVYLEKISD